METRKILTVLVLPLGLMVCSPTVCEGAPMGTAFTYQGHLYDANYVANDLYDFRFKLYDANSDGNQIGSDFNKPDIDVIDGYFTVELDFGNSLFDGDARWLEIGVRPGEQSDPCDYTILAPRQEVTPTPYALYALGGPGSSGFWAANGNRIYNTNSGNVGVGTSSPVWELEVANLTPGDGVEVGVTANDATGAVAAYSSTLGAPFEHYAGRVSLFAGLETPGLDLRADGVSGDMRFYTGGPWPGNERMRIASNGFVGIGTTGPQWQLHLQNPIEGHVNMMVEDNDGTWGTFGVNDGGNYAALSHGHGINEYWDTIVLKDGKVGIGTTGPSSQLDVVDNLAFGSIVVFENQNTGTDADGIEIQIGPSNNPASGNKFIYFRDGDGTVVGSVGGNGSGGVSYLTSSDARLKTNIVDCTEGLDVVSQMKVRNYEMNSAPGIKQIGFLAQELREVYPQAVSGSPNSDVDEEPMMIDYGRLTPILAKAIQELQAENESLKKRLESQEKTLQQLQTAIMKGALQ